MIDKTGLEKKKFRKNMRTLLKLNVDIPYIMVTAIILVVGIIFLYSSSWDYSLQMYGSETYMFKRQILWILIGLTMLLIMTFVDYNYLKKLALPGMFITIGLLVLVIIFGDATLGSVRSLVNGSITPSEAAKFAVIVYLSVWLNAKQDVLDKPKFGVFPLAIMLIGVGALIALQPDLSTAITIFMLGIMLFFLAGGDMKELTIFMVLVLIGALIAFQVYGVAQTRVDSYISGLRDPLSTSDHMVRSLEAIVNGGLWGKGIGNSSAKVTGLPVPPTDSIFAVIVEETGLVGGSFIILLYLILLWRGLKIAMEAKDLLGTLLAAGLTFWIAIEAFINAGVMVNLIPVAGNALPMVSFGGSNMVVTLTSIGIVLNISRLSRIEKAKKERNQDALDDMRRGEWRRRKPSTRSSANIES
jgi:cell division protein FtsW